MRKEEPPELGVTRVCVFIVISMVRESHMLVNPGLFFLGIGVALS
jgi:hypothetical protein